MARLLALAAALIVGLALAWSGEQTPEPRGADAPAPAFSAARAMADVRAIAARPHPIGSPENARVRDHLLARMAALGLSPQLRRDTALVHREYQGDLIAEGAIVENIVGVLPGRDRAKPAVALMAHYDSVAASPGAADDAAGVAAALEIVRAIRAEGRVPERDVMVVLTDGEETGLLGADAFFKRDPLARRIGFVLNMEARGNGGRVQMFETGRGNGADIDLFRRTAVNPVASSLTVFIYERMPNGTDFTVPKEQGIRGFNYAFVGRQFDYHATTATPALLDRGSLQDMGDQVLGTTRGLAFAATLPPKAPDAVYGQPVGDALVVYPAWAGWLVLAAAALLIAAAAFQARLHDPVHWLKVLRGAAGLLGAALGGAAVLHLARKASGAGPGLTEQRFLLAQVTAWEVTVLLLGLGALLLLVAVVARGWRWAALLPLLAGLSASAFGGFDPVGLGLGVVAAAFTLAAGWRPLPRADAWLGVLLTGLALSVLAQVFGATAAHTLSWPLLGASAAAAATALATRRGVASLAVLALVGAWGALNAAALAHGLFLSLDLLVLMVLPLMLAAFTLWPLAHPEPQERRAASLAGPALLAAGVAALLMVRLNDPWTARHPQLSNVFYHVDQDAGRAWRIRISTDRPAWSEAVLTADGGAVSRREHWMQRRPFDAAPARMVAEPAPEIALTRRADGRLLLRATPPAGARLIAFQLRPTADLTTERFDAAPAALRMPAGRWSRLWWQADPDGVEVVLRPQGPGALEVRYIVTQERWPAQAKPLPPRPANVVPFNVSESTLVTGSRRLTW
jgi:hypothetical protein